MTALWQAIKPTCDLVSGMYLVLIMLGALWVLGALVGGTTPKLIAWWERRRGMISLPVQTEARMILVAVAVVCVVMICIVLVSDAFLGEEWTFLPLPISAE